MGEIDEIRSQTYIDVVTDRMLNVDSENLMLPSGYAHTLHIAALTESLSICLLSCIISLSISCNSFRSSNGADRTPHPSVP